MSAEITPDMLGLHPALAAEVRDLASRLAANGWKALPVPFGGFDVQLYRRQAGHVDILLLARLGHALLARYVDAYQPESSPLGFYGNQVRREELPFIEALRRAVAVTDPAPTQRVSLGDS